MGYMEEERAIINARRDQEALDQLMHYLIHVNYPACEAIRDLYHGSPSEWNEMVNKYRGPDSLLIPGNKKPSSTVSNPDDHLLCEDSLGQLALDNSTQSASPINDQEFEHDAPCEYYYSTWGNVRLTHSRKHTKNYFSHVNFRFERESDDGFDFIEGELPTFKITKCFGFSESEVLWQLQDLKNNLPLIWEYSDKGGGMNA